MRDRPVKAKTRGEGDDEDADVAADGPAAPGDEETYYDAMKREMGGREARTRAALDALDPLQRVAMEGHRPGAYLRLRFTGAQLLLLQSMSLRYCNMDSVSVVNSQEAGDRMARLAVHAQWKVCA